jgi:fructooligosaccharide transport system substrate-binding protein
MGITRRQAVLAGLAAGLVLPALRRARAEITLNVVFNGWPDEQIHPLFAGFEAANPAIRTPYERIAPDELYQTLETRLNARAADPDLYSCDSDLTASYAARGHAMSLDEVLDRKRFSEGALAAATFRRKLYSAPFASSSQLLFYNRAMFREAGIEPPPADVTRRWTWEQIVEVGRKLTDTAKNQWGIVFEQPDHPYQMLPFGQSLDGSALSVVGLQAAGHIDGPEFVEGFTFLQRMYTEWKIAPPGVFDPAATTALFGGGHAAMFIGGTSNFADLPRQYKDLDWGVAPHPYFARGKPVTPTGSWHIAINPRTRNQDAAVRFIHYMTSDEAQVMWFKLVPYPPVLLSVWDQIPEAFNTDGWRIVRYELNHTAVPRPASPGYREFQELLSVTLRQMQTGGDVAVLLTNTARRIDQELEKYKN